MDDLAIHVRGGITERAWHVCCRRVSYDDPAAEIRTQAAEDLAARAAGHVAGHRSKSHADIYGCPRNRVTPFLRLPTDSLLPDLATSSGGPLDVSPPVVLQSDTVEFSGGALRDLALVEVVLYSGWVAEQRVAVAPAAGSVDERGITDPSSVSVRLATGSTEPPSSSIVNGDSPRGEQPSHLG